MCQSRLQNVVQDESLYKKLVTRRSPKPAVRPAKPSSGCDSLVFRPDDFNLSHLEGRRGLLHRSEVQVPFPTTHVERLDHRRLQACCFGSPTTVDTEYTL
ncbi:hypothetical protein WJX74_000221 [Apatococcus lobatus]|uniref:Uncharacterized protein n=1 Tax=Apatococcus lobatus TaxID=904363 RepID=A0AAW1QUA9_9CHLO